MVTLSRTKKPVHEPASIVVCLEGFCMSNPRGVDMIAVRGARLRGDSPIVVARRCPVFTSSMLTRPW